jgi:uncharacterized protein YggE
MAENTGKEEAEPMSSIALPPHTHQTVRSEGVTVVGEAVRRVAPDTLELLVEINAGASTAAQALRDNQTRTAQVIQAVSALGVQQGDVETISRNIYNLYSPMMAVPPAYGPQQIAQAGFSQAGFSQAGFGQGGLGQGGFGQGGFGQVGFPDVQFGSYQVRNTVRLTVKDPARAGEIVDAVSRAGGTIVGGFSFKASDEAGARRSALEAAARDAKAKAEALATAAGKRAGDLVSISEEILATNGAYMALRSAAPFAFGAGAPPAIGELEYYARVSANFKLQ